MCRKCVSVMKKLEQLEQLLKATQAILINRFFVQHFSIAFALILNHFMRLGISLNSKVVNISMTNPGYPLLILTQDFSHPKCYFFNLVRCRYKIQMKETYKLFLIKICASVLLCLICARKFKVSIKIDLPTNIKTFIFLETPFRKNIQ